MMEMKLRVLTFLGLCAYLGFLLLQTPVTRVLTWLPSSLHVYGAEGTVPAGHAALVQWQEWRFENVTWELRLLPLTTGRLEFDVSFRNADESRGQAQAGVTLQHQFYLTDPRIHLRINALAPLKPMLANVDGWITADLAYVTWSNPHLSVAGQVNLENVAWAAKPPIVLGDVAITLETTPEQNVVGHIADRGALVALQGQLVLDPQGVWRLNAMITPRANTPPQVTRFLSFLGPPDGEGRSVLSVEGRLGEH